jgi:transcription-repair coupling factor (superfamily II helicase)
MFLNAKAMSMFQEEISQLNVQQLKAGEKRWLGNLLGSSAALFIHTLSSQNKKLFVVVADKGYDSEPLREQIRKNRD